MNIDKHPFIFSMNIGIYLYSQIYKKEMNKMPHGMKHRRNRKVKAAKLFQTRRRENFDKMMERFETEKRIYME